MENRPCEGPGDDNQTSDGEGKWLSGLAGCGGGQSCKKIFPSHGFLLTTIISGPRPEARMTGDSLLLFCCQPEATSLYYPTELFDLHFHQRSIPWEKP